MIQRIGSVLAAAICLIVLSLVSVPLVHAQQIEMSSSLNPVGSGARATGMGGAFIGVADDATAASWNPAGLVQLEKPEVSLVYSGQERKQTYHSTLHPEIDGTNSMDSSGINYFSAAYPFVLLNRNMIVSLNYQRLYEMDKKVLFSRRTVDIANGLDRTEATDFKQNGFLYALSPAMAVQVTPALYVGVTVNIWKDYLGENGWESSFRGKSTSIMSLIPPTATFVDDVKWEQHNSFSGYNANFGVLWNMTDSLALGAVYKNAFDGHIKKEQIFSDVQTLDSLPWSANSIRTSDNLSLKMPASYGIGFKYRRSDLLTFAFDVYRTQWSRFYLKDQKGNAFNPMDGASLAEGRLKDTTQVRLGTEYLFIGNNRTIVLRAGLFSDPEPTKTTLDKFYGFSLGTGYSTQRFSLDASYQYRLGKDVSSDISYIQPKSVDIVQQTLMLSGIVYF